MESTGLMASSSKGLHSTPYWSVNKTQIFLVCIKYFPRMAEILFGRMLLEDFALHTLCVHLPLSNAENRHKIARLKTDCTWKQTVRRGRKKIEG